MRTYKIEVTAEEFMQAERPAQESERYDSVWVEGFERTASARRQLFLAYIRPFLKQNGQLHISFRVS